MDLKLFGAIVILAGIPTSIILSKLRDLQNRRRALAHLAKNPPLAPATFAATHFPANQATIARRLRELLAPHLPFDLARLHPDDRLVEDLRMDALDSMSTVEFILSVEKEFSVKITEAEAAKLRTFRDVIACVARLLSARGIIPPDHGSSLR